MKKITADNITTIGVYDKAEDAYDSGNKICELLESIYKKHIFPSGAEAKKEKFSKNGGPFGYPNHLITNMAYLHTPFDFFLKITKLKYNDIKDILNEANKACERYSKFKLKNL